MADPSRNAPQYWHGGIQGLRPGEPLLPSAKTEGPCFIKDESVYFSTDARAAYSYARCYPGGGAVYRVRPIGEIEPDPRDPGDGRYWRARSAVVIDCVIPSVEPNEDAAYRAFLYEQMKLVEAMTKPEDVARARRTLREASQAQRRMREGANRMREGANRDAALMVLMPSRSAPRPESVSALKSNMDGVPHVLLTLSGFPVEEARNALAKAAIERTEDDRYGLGPKEWFVLFVDDDAWWPSGTITTMLRAMREYPQVDALFGYFSLRSAGLPAVARLKWGQCEHSRKEWCSNHPAANGQQIPAAAANCENGDIVRVEDAGFHFALMRRDLLKRVGRNPFSVPCYELAPGMEAQVEPRYGLPTNAVVPEDTAFCERAIDAGALLCVATGCTILHIGRDDQDGWGFYPMAQPLNPTLLHHAPKPHYTRLCVDDGPPKPAVSRRKRRYYHGGAPGQNEGDVLRPSGDEGPMVAVDGIYITPFRIDALQHAQCYAGGGAVYEVRPIGPVTTEPREGARFLYYKASSARIVSVLTPRVRPNKLGEMRSLAKEMKEIA